MYVDVWALMLCYFVCVYASARSSPYFCPILIRVIQSFRVNFSALFRADSEYFDKQQPLDFALNVNLMHCIIFIKNIIGHLNKRNKIENHDIL